MCDFHTSQILMKIATFNIWSLSSTTYSLWRFFSSNQPIARISREKKSRTMIFGRPCNWKPATEQIIEAPANQKLAAKFSVKSQHVKIFTWNADIAWMCHMDRLSNVEIAFEFWNEYTYICPFLFCRMWIVGAKNACSGSS